MIKAFVSLSSRSPGLETMLSPYCEVALLPLSAVPRIRFSDHLRSVVVIDLRVAAQQGIATVADIRKTYGYGPGVLALTRQGDAVTTISALESGADTFLHVPVSASTLAAAIFSLGRLTGALPTRRFKIAVPTRACEELI